MKALMSVVALIGVLGLLMLIGMIFGVVPSNTVRLVEGYMPMQVLSELAIFVAGFTGLSYLANSMGIAFPGFGRVCCFGLLSKPISSSVSIHRFHSAFVPCTEPYRS